MSSKHKVAVMAGTGKSKSKRSSFPVMLCSGVVALIAATSAFTQPAAPEPPPDSTKNSEPAPLDMRLHRLWLKFESEIAFLLPEGEFDAALEKKFGHFLVLSNAQYNFVRGAMGFQLRNVYTRFRVVPQLAFHDRLDFVPLFSPERTWRREQGMKAEVSLPLWASFYTATSFYIQRFSFPSSINFREIESQHIRSLGQTFGARADSTRFWGLTHTGILALEVARAFHVAGGEANFTQLSLAGNLVSQTARLSLINQLRSRSMLGGRGAPVVFLGGRGKISGYRENEFSGIDFIYFSHFERFSLKKGNMGLVSQLAVDEVNGALHVETGQIGNPGQLLHFSSYHTSIGAGAETVIAYRQQKAFELFLYVYKALEHDREPRYYFGVKY